MQQVDGRVPAPRVDPYVDLGSAIDQPDMWLFIGILVTFLITRGITRRIRHRERTPAAESGTTVLRNLSFGGVHLHHQVFGILLMLVAGIVLISFRPDGAALNIVAAAFGVGVSLAFDEFALWLHLEDVYWSEEGRKSVDAIFIVLAVTGILIGGSDIFPEENNAWVFVALVSTVGVLCLTCLLKGKVATGTVGILLWPMALIGALRLAKPGSWWARRWYPQRPNTFARCLRRFGPAYDRRWNRLRDLVGGAPTADPAVTRPARPQTGPPALPGGPSGDRVGGWDPPGGADQMS